MSGITLSQAETRLALWLAADTSVAAGQVAEIDGRKLTRVDAAEIRTNIDYWHGWCVRLGGGRNGRPVIQVSPL